MNSDSANPEPQTPVGSAATSALWSPTLPTTLVACALGCVAGFGILHSLDPLFKMEELPELGIAPSAEAVQRFQAATKSFWGNNSAADFSIMGLCVGLAVGGVAVTRRRGLSAIAGGLAGALGGLAAGYGVGMFIAQSVLASADQSLFQSAGAHFLVWFAVFTCVTLAVGVCQSGLLSAGRYVLAGVVSGVGIAAVYNLASSLLFMNANLLLVFPATLSERLVWVVISGLVSGLSLFFSFRTQMNSAKST